MVVNVCKFDFMKSMHHNAFVNVCCDFALHCMKFHTFGEALFESLYNMAAIGNKA